MHNLTLLAQTPAGLYGYSIGEIIKWVIIICAVIGIAYVACNYFGVWPPAWLVKIIGIVVVAFVSIWAVKLLIAM